MAGLCLAVQGCAVCWDRVMWLTPCYKYYGNHSIRIQLDLFGTQRRMRGPYVAAMNQILIPVKAHAFWPRQLCRPLPSTDNFGGRCRHCYLVCPSDV
jgi:hypothetical protein